MSDESLGRKVTISIDGAVVAVARTKSLTINNSTINVTSDGDDGIQRLLSDPGEKSVEISVDGLADLTVAGETNPLLDIALGNDLSAAIIFDYGTYTLTGTFMQTTYSEGLPYNEAVTFSSAFSSSGALVKAVTP